MTKHLPSKIIQGHRLIVNRKVERPFPHFLLQNQNLDIRVFITDLQDFSDSVAVQNSKKFFPGCAERAFVFTPQNGVAQTFVQNDVDRVRRVGKGLGFRNNKVN